jgi:S-adenosylhomocysteine hydrolase
VHVCVSVCLSVSGGRIKDKVTSQTAILVLAIPGSGAGVSPWAGVEWVSCQNAVVTAILHGLSRVMVE